MLYRLTLHYGPQERLILDDISEQQKNSVLRDWHDDKQSTIFFWQPSKVMPYRKAMITDLVVEEMPHVDKVKTGG